MQPKQVCQMLKSQSSYWYVIKSVLQIIAFYVVYYLAMHNNDLAEVDFEMLLEKQRKMRDSNNDMIETIKKMRADYEAKKERRESFQERIKEILLVLGMLKCVSLGRYFFKKIALQNQCLRSYQSQFNLHGSTPRIL